MSSAIAHRGIVVGVDGSANSDVAIVWAAREAAMRNVALTVAHVTPALSVNWSLTLAPAGLATWQTEQGNQILAAAVKIAQEAVGPDCWLNIDTGLREAEARWVTDRGTLAGDRRWTLSTADATPAAANVTR